MKTARISSSSIERSTLSSEFGSGFFPVRELGLPTVIRLEIEMPAGIVAKNEKFPLAWLCETAVSLFEKNASISIRQRASNESKP